MSDPLSTGKVIKLNAKYAINDEVLHHIALGTATKSGQCFFSALVEHTAKALNADMVFVTECTKPDLTEVRTLANWYKGKLAQDFEYEIPPYPCKHVMQGNIYVHPARLLEAYPNEIEGMDSYIGLPLISTKDVILGHIVVMNEYAIDDEPRGLSALRIFAARAAVELERLRIEAQRDQAFQSLEQRVEERTREIERRRQIAENLREVLRTINAQSPIEKVLNQITQATSLLGADAVVTCQYLEDDQSCLVQAQRGLALEQYLVAKEPPGWDLIRDRLGELAPITINESVNVSIPSENGAETRPFQALLAVPLLIQNAAYGYLILYYLDHHQFEDEEIKLAVTFADQMALALENSHLRQEAQRLAAFEERSRLARELHDAVTQTLWSASLLADVIPSMWERNPARAAERLDQLRQLNRLAHEEMRALLLGLRPQALVETKLDDLLRQLIATTEGRAGIEIGLSVSGTFSMVPADVQIAFYRVAQEALNNVIRHAQADQVSVNLVCGEDADGGVLMSVHDDGLGFDPTAITSNHFGTKIMRERAATIGAHYSVSSQPGAGTSIYLKWLAPDA